MTSGWTPYCGPGATPLDVLDRWNGDPIVMAVLFAGLVLAISRAERRTPAVAACLILALVFLSPLCAMSSALFTVRTVHHLLLVAGAAPLIALALPRRWKGLAAATVVQTTVFWVWHAPAVYSEALSNDLIYWLMQISLLASAVWFWSAVRASSAPAAVAGLLVTTVQMGLLGALIAFAGQPLYAPHLLTTAVWGLTPLEDQQVAGLLMWAPALGLYLAAALWRIARLIGPDQTEARAS